MKLAPADRPAPRAGHPAVEAFRRDLMDGLQGTPKTIPCKYLYDARGSELFEAICALDEYYPTRTEFRILAQRAGEIAALAGPACALVELGSGSSRKTRLVLDRLANPVVYVPVEISPAALNAATHALRRNYSGLPLLPVCADYTQAEWRLPEPAAAAPRRLFFFPGSTVGNFTPDEAREFLVRLRHHGTTGDGLLLGVDLVKDSERLEAAYNDRSGVTAAFNLNLLHRANRELGTDFDAMQFMHAAIFNQAKSRVEMQLISCRAQTVHLEDNAIHFGTGEFITTEYSYKYRVEAFAELARASGFNPAAVWTDPLRLFSVHYFVAAGGGTTS